MQMDIAYAKTALGRSYLEQPPAPERRARRSLLIMMDGQRTLEDLLPVIRTLGLTLQDVQAMVAQGLLEPARGRAAAVEPPKTWVVAPDEPAKARVAAPAEPAKAGIVPMEPAKGRAAAAEPAKLPAMRAEPARSLAPQAERPARSAPPPAAPASAGRSRPAPTPTPAGALSRPRASGLAGLQHAAAQVLSRMLGRTSSRLHERLLAVDSGTALAEWVAECSMYLAAVSGTRHAAQFRAQMSALLAAVSRGEAAVVAPSGSSTPMPAPMPAPIPAKASAAPVPTPARSPARLADLVPGRVEPSRGRKAEPTTGPGALLEEG
jgi:hypothetical protein